MRSLLVIALLNPALALVCNGTGELYQDSTGCECDETFAATSEGCAADADGSAPLSLDGGNPLVLQEWWQNASFASGELDDWLSYRPGYGPPEALMPRLEATIRALHVAEGNVDETIAREYHLVVGAGSTNVLTALLFAAASEGPADTSMFVRAPHWFHYSHLAAMNLPLRVSAPSFRCSRRNDDRRLCVQLAVVGRGASAGVHGRRRCSLYPVKVDGPRWHPLRVGPGPR